VRVLSKRFTRSHGESRASRGRVVGRVGLVATLVIAIATLLGGAHADAKRSQELQTGLAPIHFDKLAPNFVYDDGDGPKKLSDSLGSPVLVHFWTTYCEPCTDELPLIIRAEREDPQLVVITLNDEPPGVARTYLKKQGIGLPVAEDPDHKVWDAYGVRAIPVSVFLRTDGTVEHVSVGEMDWNEIATALVGLRP
jgi:thiol-disulfide isomerase/thioredoxin